MHRLSKPLKYYAALVLFLGLTVLGYSVAVKPLQATPQSLSLTVAFAILIGLASVYSIPLSPKIKVNVVTAPAFAAVLLLHPALAAMAGIVGVAVSELVQTRRLPYVLFNTATAALYIGGAAIASNAFKSGEQFFAWPMGVMSTIIAAVTIYVINRTVVAQAAAIQVGQNAFRLWQKEWKQDIFQELALFSLGFAGALSAHLVTWSIVLLVPPVVVVYKVMSKVVALSIKLEAQMVELRATQAQLVQAAKMASLGTLTAGLAHQINNPIFVIRGRTELLLEGADRHLKTDKTKQHIEVIHDMADRVARIVRCLLTSTRPSEDGRACTGANDALETMVSLLDSKISGARVQVTRNYEENLPLVPGDAIEIQEMLRNLISNACDAMPQGGELKLATRVIGSSVTIEVCDNGVGIPESNLIKIFDPFFTTKETSGGVGLGLYVAKNIAEKHGGVIQVESEYGRGTTFRVVLPIADNYFQRIGKQAEKPTARVK